MVSDIVQSDIAYPTSYFLLVSSRAGFFATSGNHRSWNINSRRFFIKRSAMRIIFPFAFVHGCSLASRLKVSHDESVLQGMVRIIEICFYSKRFRIWHPRPIGISYNTETYQFNTIFWYLTEHYVCSPDRIRYCFMQSVRLYTSIEIKLRSYSRPASKAFLSSFLSFSV